MHVLKLTSRTFYIPITLLKRKLKLTVGSAYLCMRAIDEIEDHEQLELAIKNDLLRKTANLLRADGEFNDKAYRVLIDPYKSQLAEVTIRLGDWLKICPTDIVAKIKQTTAEMADGMADWVQKNWHIQTREDLDSYT